MTRTLLVIPLLAALATSGCSTQGPIAENFPLSTQKVATSAHHWNVVAADVVAQTADSIQAIQALQSRGIYVPVSEKNTAFNAIFREFLITQMVDQNMDVITCRQQDAEKGGFVKEAPAIEVQYETRIIRHGYPASRHPAGATLLAAGVAVLHNIVSGDLSRGAENTALILGGAAADGANRLMPNATSTELIVTTTIAEANHYVMRRSDIYYVPDSDAGLFTQRVSQSNICNDGGKKAAMKGINTAIDPGEDEQSRREMIARNQARFNPKWKGAAYAY